MSLNGLFVCFANRKLTYFPLQILASDNLGENMAGVQGLLKKHATLDVDLALHKQRVEDLDRLGQQVGGRGIR